MKISLSVLLLCSTFAARAGVLPGFRVVTLGHVDGFATSIAVDSHGMVYVTTTDGWIHRFDGSTWVNVASLPTHSGGDSGLLGMALLDDETAAVHYTTWGTGNLVLDDVVSRVDLTTGAETPLHTFVCDINVRDHGASTEHHGGNPTVAADGAIFVGIGDYGTLAIAQEPEWNAGKIWRIDPAGNATQWAIGVRNPFDLAWDPELGEVVVTDNGPQAGDELNVVAAGSNCGWPKTYGDQPPVADAVPPAYVFPSTVAPTGMARLDGANPLLHRGYLLGSYVAKSLFYFPTVTPSSSDRLDDPVAIIDHFNEAIIDVAAGPSGAIYLVTAAFPGTSTIRRLDVPARGDCNGDGSVDVQDWFALKDELSDAPSQPMIEAQSGAHAGSWGCDVNADGWIDDADLVALRPLLTTRRRAVR